MSGQVDSCQIPAYVLEHHTPDDVAKAMIEGGQQSAFYTFNMDEAYNKIRLLQNLLPRVKIFYAMKANSTEMMLQLAAALGLGFDCASPVEIYRVRRLRVRPNSIIYAAPCKSPEEMKYAESCGIQHTTFDSSCELHKIKTYWPQAMLLIRIRVDGDAERKLGLKFGCDFETEATALLDEAASLGLNVLGVAFHVGSVCYTLESYAVALRQARALFAHEARRGRRMRILDIGGGFYSHTPDAIHQASCLINDKLAELFPDPTVHIIAEPGRYLCATAFKMYCRVIGIKKGIQNNVSVNMIQINNGIYGTMGLCEKWHRISKFPRSKEMKPDLEEETILWGPTCDPEDRVMENSEVHLPQCAPSDWLAVEDHGAYTLVFAAGFSGSQAPLVRPVVSRKLWGYINKSSVFRPSDFVLNPDISEPLPSLLPPVCDVNDDLENPTFHSRDANNSTLES